MKHIIDLCTADEDLRVVITLRKNKGYDLVWPPAETLAPSFKGTISETLIVKDWVKDVDAAGNKITGSPVDQRIVLVFEKKDAA
ncbi:MAG: hypothetical protein EOP62_23655 [Sphingomonadales bacterium]|nr:MAG: hypothetical protein EOP62_23655 [Sphingomonadales bacterium]